MISTSFSDFHQVSEKLPRLGLVIKEANIEMIPKNLVRIEDVEVAKTLMALIEALEDNDDVQNVWANFDMDEILMERASA